MDGGSPRSALTGLKESHDKDNIPNGEGSTSSRLAKANEVISKRLPKAKQTSQRCCRRWRAPRLSPRPPATARHCRNCVSNRRMSIIYACKNSQELIMRRYACNNPSFSGSYACKNSKPQSLERRLITGFQMGSGQTFVLQK